MSATLSPRLRALALTPVDVILNVRLHKCCSYPLPDEPAVTQQAGRSPDYGKVTRVAKAFVAGAYPGLSYFDVAEQEGLDGGSLKNTIWRERNPKPKTKGGDSYGRVREVAIEFAAGKFGAAHHTEVALSQGLNSESLRVAIYKARYASTTRRSA